jgi:hypothetical protein
LACGIVIAGQTIPDRLACSCIGNAGIVLFRVSVQTGGSAGVIQLAGGTDGYGLTIFLAGEKIGIAGRKAILCLLDGF